MINDIREGGNLKRYSIKETTQFIKITDGLLVGLLGFVMVISFKGTMLIGIPTGIVLFILMVFSKRYF